MGFIVVIVISVFKTPSIIDIEASGFGAKSFPIEVGVALPDGQRFCRLIKPLKHWTFWDESAQTIHGISKQELSRNGEDAIAVCLALNDFARGMTLYSDAWVVDQPWLLKLYGECAVQMAFSVSPLEMILSEGQISLWDDEKVKVIAQSELVRHRASADADIIQQTFQRTRELMQHSQ